MNFVQRVVKNVSVFLAAQVITCLLSFFFFIYVARYLGAADFGIISFALALAAIVSIFTDLGLMQLIVREVARDKSLVERYLGNVAGIKIILFAISLIGLILFVNIVGYPAETKKVVYLIILSVFFGAFAQIFYAIFQAYERIEFESLGRILSSALLLGALLVVASAGKLTVLTIASLYSLASAVVLGYAFIIFLWKFAKPKIKVGWKFWNVIVRESLSFGLVGVFGTLLHWIDTVMLSIMKDDAAVGWYGVAYRIFFVLLFIPSAFDVTIFPAMSRFFISSRDSLKIICEKYFKYMSIIGIPIGIGGMLLADKIIFLLFGREYIPSIIAFKILVWSAVLVFLGTPFSTLLNSINRQLVLAKIVGVSTVFNILLNLILIPKYSYIGASIATVVSMLLILFGVIMGTARIGYKMPILKMADPVLKAVFSSLIMGIFIVWFKDINIFFLIVSSAIIYFVLLYLIKGFNKGFKAEELISAPKNLIFRALGIPLKPRWVVFMPTDACNSHCLHCDIWRQKPTRDYLSPEEIEKAFSDKFFNNIEFVMITGGEPTVRGDLKDVILGIHSALPWASIQLSTNALLPERALEAAKTAIENNINFEVGISLDGIGKEHDRLRGTEGNFEKADWLLRQLVELRKKYKDKLGIAAGVVLSDFTLHSLQEIREYAKELEISLVEAWYNESSFYHNVGKNKFQRQLFEAVKSQPPSLIQENWLKFLKGESIKFPCFALNTFFILKCNGDVAPCLNLWDLKAGNVRDNSASEIWHSFEAKKARNAVKKCQGCLNGWGAGWSFRSSYYQILSFYIRHKFPDFW